MFAGGECVDRYDGRGGKDVLWLKHRFGYAGPHGAVVDLSLARDQVRDDGFGNCETLVSIENVVGTFSDDRIEGPSDANVLEGQFGAGTLTGSGGVDVFKYFPEGNLGEGDVITDF